MRDSAFETGVFCYCCKHFCISFYYEVCGAAVFSCRSLLKGQVQCFSMQTVMIKCFLKKPEKNWPKLIITITELRYASLTLTLMNIEKGFPLTYKKKRATCQGK